MAKEKNMPADAEKVQEEVPAKAEKEKSAARNYHVAKRPDGKWQVNFAGGEKAIKLFSTQAEAIAYARGYCSCYTTPPISSFWGALRAIFRRERSAPRVRS